ncbi:RagB/SusD family nutrient uptake outer membrane protein [Jiulongibacter sp. NS-SX5]|uniref:RagB/SusD family nutrient uptake outer membrane protein n=1 Tax=Jiulongibacter sp. NS-SX5 TaxID=3463854 RepID=UPI004059F45E
MKLNRLKNIVLLGAIGLSMTSCEKFLEEQNKSNVTAESYYVTQEGFEALVNANYAQLRTIYGDEAWMFSCGTDLYAEGRTPEPLGLSQYRDLDPSSEGVDHLYRTCYAAIQLANQGLYYSEQLDSYPALNERIAELKFLRANAYFLLVQSYGGVTLLNEYIKEAVYELERNSAEEIYAQIISDLDAAASGLSSGAYNGRANQRAAQNLLGKVYLTRGYESFGSSDDFTKAASLFDQVIGGEGLSLTFEELWDPNNDGNSETIFSVQYSPASVSVDPQNLGNRQSSYFGPYMGGTEVAGNAPYRTYNLIASDYAIDLFTEDDARWEGTFMTKMYTRYFDYYDVDDKSSLEVARFYEPSWFTAEDSVAFMTANPNAAYHSYGSYSSQTVSSDNQTIPVKKFDDPKAPFGAKTSTRDIVLARLGETYLLAAEANLQAGNASKGLDLLNVVRERAGVAPATADVFDIDYILDERARELFGEYHRWFDLKRTGTLVRRTAQYHRLVSESDFAGANGEQKILRPIPREALDLNQNDSYAQNPAYN